MCERCASGPKNQQSIEYVQVLVRRTQPTNNKFTLMNVIYRSRNTMSAFVVGGGGGGGRWCLWKSLIRKHVDETLE